MAKVVIIEDDPILARIYENKLRLAGNEVIVATDGESGLEIVKATKPNLVLVDLMLPNLSGIEVIKNLRRDITVTRIPIIAYSGADEDIMAEAREANPTVLLSKKTMSPKEIFENVQAVLETSRLWKISAEHPTEFALGDEKEIAPFSQGRILVVEDDAIIVKIVKTIIEKAGYETVTTGDGGEALRILSKDSNFVAGVFDVDVPKIKGTDLLRHMRTEKRLMRIPVMMMTADESVRLQLDTHEAGAAIFLPKPFERVTFEKMFFLLVGKNK